MRSLPVSNLAFNWVFDNNNSKNGKFEFSFQHLIFIVGVSSSNYMIPNVQSKSINFVNLLFEGLQSKTINLFEVNLCALLWWWDGPIAVGFAPVGLFTPSLK